MNLTLKAGLDLTTSEGKEALATAMFTVPQLPAPVIHRFGPGIYIREAHYPANSIIVGQEHLQEHLNVLLKGKINVIDGQGNLITLEAPHIFTAPPGSKVGYIIEDVIWQNIYATTETDVEVLEKLLFKTTESFEEFRKRDVVCNTDFELMLKETGWAKEQMDSLSGYRGDCIPFPYGSYKVAQGPSTIHGRGLMASADIAEGETIAPMRLNGKRTPAGYLINHSNEPNCISFKIGDDLYVKALKPIKGMLGGLYGEELTLNYRQVMKINNLWDGVSKCQQE